MDARPTRTFESGANILRLLDSLQDAPEDDMIADDNTPASRLLNWNHLSSRLQKIDVTVESDTRALILASDNTALGTPLVD